MKIFCRQFKTEPLQDHDLRDHGSSVQRINLRGATTLLSIWKIEEKVQFGSINT